MIAAAASMLLAQNTNAPVISANGVVNAASYTQPSFPGGSLAQGTIFSVFGSNLGPATPPPEPSSYPLQPSLGGVSIAVTQGKTIVQALPFYVSATQVSAILPSNTPLGADQLVLTYNGASTATYAVNVVASSVGLFSVNSGGFGPGVIQNYVSATSLPVNSRSVSAMPGQIVEMYGTGLGPSLNADNQPPQAGNLPVKTEVFVGGQPAAIAYSGRSPCCSGLDQFVFTIPLNVPLGCNVPVEVRTAGATPSNVVTTAISADGSPCSDALAPFGNIVGGGASGAITLTRTKLPLGPMMGAVDSFFATFRKENGGDFAFNSLLSLPPVGSCTSMAQTGNLLTSLPGFASTGGDLNAGSVSVTNSKNTVSSSGPVYAAFLAISTSITTALATSFLDQGPFTAKGGGGQGVDVGSFTVAIPSTPQITLSNPGATINRSQDLTVNWSFGGAGTSGLAVLIEGTNYTTLSNQAVSFLCSAAASAGTFTVPSYILERLPATDTSSPEAAISILLAGAVPMQPAASFNATGLDRGNGSMITASGSYVTYQ
jgi:uncharacterized protein (TIGR03437 family)